MEIKPNDMFLATISNPNAKTYDFINNNVTSENTQILSKDDYKHKDTIKAKFTNEEGKFDDVMFDNFYNVALYNYNQLSNEKAIADLDVVEYDPFDSTRPKGAKLRAVEISFSQDNNPHMNLYSRDGFNTITESTWSMRELAQKGKIWNPETNKFEKSINDSNIVDRIFGDTLIYAQWDEDGVHTDPSSGNTIKHRKGDWKLDDEGKFHLEKLGNREIYGKQVVNVSDILTTDGSALNKALDFMDSDGREKSMGKTVVKAMVEIAPFFIPVIGTGAAAISIPTIYGGMRAAVGMASVLPTFYKSIEGILRGDDINYGNDPITKAEGWMAKFGTSTSDVGSEGFWNFEQMASMVTGIFSQIHEQRAVAGLSTILMKPDKLLNKKVEALQAKALLGGLQNKVDPSKVMSSLMSQSKTVKEAFEKQSQLSKAFSLGYMALTSTGDIYEEALESGYDRRTAGFSSLLAASGQYGIMMNNRMATWFLDKTTGYNVEVSKGELRKALVPEMKKINDVMTNSGLSKAVKRGRLADITMSFKNSLRNNFSSVALTTNAIGNNMLTEGFEEVSEELVMDATKGIVDVLSYLGITKNQGSFRTVEKFSTGEAFQNYLTNFVGGLIGGGLFELERTKISPWLNREKISPAVDKQLIHWISEGYTEELIDLARKEGKYITNDELSFVVDGDNFAPKNNVSQADVVVEQTINRIQNLHHILNSEGLNLTDDEIIQKAIRTEVIMKNMDESVTESNPEGLQGLVINDFRNSAAKIVDIKKEITALESQEGNEEQIKVQKDKLKIYKDKVNKILSGEMGMHYFDQIVVSLDPDIQRIFGSLDKGSFIEAKYDVKYTTLPEDGLGLTKKKADEDWDDFLTSTDVVKKLEIITAAYKKLEQTLNNPIDGYVSNGYIEERIATSKAVIDLEKTIKNYNTATSQEEKSYALTQFKAINKNLESAGIMKILPHDSFINDLAQDLFDNQLIKKRVINEEGEVVLVDYTAEELGTITKNGTTLEESIKATFNEFSKSFPVDPLDTEAIIYNFNSFVDQYNNKIDINIEQLEQSDTDGSRAEEIEQLKRNRINYAAQTYSDTESYKNLNNKRVEEIETIYEKSIDGRTSEESEKAEQSSAKEGRKIIEKYIELKNSEDMYKDDDNKNYIDLNYFINKIVTGETDFNNLTDADKVKVLKLIQDRGILDKIMQDNPGIREMAENIEALIALLESTKVTAEVSDPDSSEAADHPIVDGDVESAIRNFEGTLIELIEDHISQSVNLLENPEMSNYIQQIKDINIKYDKEFENSKPEVFKIRNLAFNLLIDSFKNGHMDNELFLMAKRMYNEEIAVLEKQIIPTDVEMNSKFIEYLIDNEVDIAEFYDILYEHNSEGALESDDTIGDMELYREFMGNDPLIDFMINAFNPDTNLLEAVKILGDLWKSNTINNSKKKLSDLKEFRKLNEGDFKKNPVLEMLRKFSMTMNSNPNSAVNKIFDILEVEELSFKAASGVEAYIADGARVEDLQQAINILDMFNTVVSKMSTTSYFDGDLSGFIAMRQSFAKALNIKDDVTDLKTINSDQSAIISRDLKGIRTKLQFLLDLSKDNKRQKNAEHENGRIQMDLVNNAIWQDFIDNEALIAFIPPKAAEILNSQDDPETKNIKLETAFYEHNKLQKEEALTAILGQLSNVSAGNVTAYTASTTENTIMSFNKALYFATNLELNSMDHARRQILSLEGDINKAPFYTQEVAAKVLRASTQNPELFAKIFEIKENKLFKDASFISFLLGQAGSGKTTVVIALILDIIRQTNNSSAVWMAGPSKEQGTKLSREVISTVKEHGFHINSFSKHELFSQFGEGILKIYNQITADLKDLSAVYDERVVSLNTTTGDLEFNIKPEWSDLIDFDKLPNMLVIDEITHYNTAEIMLLNFISVESNKHESANFMKILAVGDNTQIGYKVKRGSQFFEYNVNSINGIFAPPLTLSVRASNEAKRVNLDTLTGLVKSANKIHSAEINKAIEGAQTAEEAYKNINSKFKKDILQNVRANLGLKYFLSEDVFQGDYIAKSEKDSEIYRTIKNSMDKDPTQVLGILTEKGELDENLKEVLEDIFGKEVIADSKRVKLFTKNNVQGSEVDFFIFDTKLIDPYNNLKDVLRAFYTYQSRSKVGTVIIDSNNRIYDELNIENSPKSNYPVTIDSLDSESIKELKEIRLAKLRKILGDDMNISKEDNFKWRKGLVEVEEDVTEIVIQPSATNLILSTDPTSKVNTSKEIEEDTVYPKGMYGEENFGVMLHSFYNNPNAKITQDSEGKITGIQVHNGINTDLNGVENVDSKEEAFKIVNEWGKLRNVLLRKEMHKIRSYDYPSFFKHVFGKDVSGMVDVKLLRTATLFDEDNNTPYKKFGFDKDALIQEGEPFLNITAELTAGNSTHYVTLATMAKMATFFEKGLPNFNPGKDFLKKRNQTKEQYHAALEKGIRTNMGKLYTRLETMQTEGKHPFIVLEHIPFVKEGKKVINLITSTRLYNKKDVKVEHLLTDLQDDFVGMNYSKIKIFPNTYPEFKALVNSYTFGKARNEQTIKDMFNGKKGKNGEFLQSSLAGKPYMVVSFDTNLNGGEGTSAKLVVVNSKGRDLATLTNEVNQIKEDLNNELKAYYDSDDGGEYETRKKNYTVSNEINVKSEALLNRSQILDILIEWAQTSSEDSANPDETLLDLLTKEVNVSSVGSSANTTTTTLLHILDNFKKSSDGELSISTSRLLTVIESVKKHINDADVKQAVIKDISKLKLWNWTFHNIFALSDAINKAEKQDFKNVLASFNFDNLNLAGDSDYDLFREFNNKLIGHLKKDDSRLFYYSLPITTVSGKGTAIQINPLMSGKTGFSKEFFGDKFYLSQTPESERGIIPLSMYRNLDPDNSSISHKKGPREVTKKKPPITPPDGAATLESLFGSITPSLITLLDLYPAQKAIWENVLSKTALKIGVTPYTETEILDKVISGVVDAKGVTSEDVDLSSPLDSEDFFALLELESTDESEALAEKLEEEYTICKK